MKKLTNIFNISDVYQKYPLIINGLMLLFGLLVGYLIFHQVNEPEPLPKKQPAPVPAEQAPQVQERGK